MLRFFKAILCTAVLLGQTVIASDPEVEYFLGEARYISGPYTGRASGPLLLKIEVSRASKRISQMLFAGPQSYFPYKAVTITLDRTGPDKFRETAVANGKTLFQGEAKVSGPDWAWTSWLLERRLENGVTTRGVLTKTDTTLSGQLTTSVPSNGKTSEMTEDYSFTKVGPEKFNSVYHTFTQSKKK